MTATRRLLVLVAGVTVGCAGLAMAGQQRSSRVSDQQMQEMVNRLDIHRDAFHGSLQRAIGRSPFKGTASEDDIDQFSASFYQAVDQLRDHMNDRRSETGDADNVLQRAVPVDRFLVRHQLDASVQADWRTLRQDMDELAFAFGISWDWAMARPARAVPVAAYRPRLTGTYQLDTNGSDDPRRAADAAAREVPADQRLRTSQGLMARLEAPDLIAIERNQDSVTMASTRGQRVTVDADGRDHLERWSPDRATNTRVTFEGERLVVTTSGSRGRDFTVTFDPMEDGSGLQMTRTIDDEALRQAVTVRSAYRRVSDAPRWDVNAPTAEAAFVPDGTRVVAVLDTALSTTTARDGDLYTMTARGPSPYEGAIIQGVVLSATESGRLTGRSGLTLSLRSIRLRNGSLHAFDGVIEHVRTPGGETVRVDREGVVEGDGSQTQKTVERGAIGAALGAIIGAVAGGGKGAAIGGVIGAGGGAGTVMMEGRDRIDLPRGTEVSITSGVPGPPRALPGVQR